MHTLKFGHALLGLAALGAIALASPALAQDGPAKPAKPAATPRKPSEASLEARHKICLDFIQRHGRSCDPWQTPTCGYDIGFARPMECVAP